MIHINKLLGIQQAYAQEDELTPLWWTPWWVIIQPTTTIPDISNDILFQCQKKYSSVLDSVSTVQERACMCTSNNSTTISCTQITQDYLNQQLCSSAPKHSTWDTATGQCVCAAWLTDTWANGTRECINNAYGNLGIQCSSEQMRNGTCSRNINKTLGIRTSDTTSNPTLFVQDIVLAATSFVGTLMVIALVVMWLRYVQGGMDESSTGNLKWNIKKLLIWLGLVIGSYTIIRLIQYIARWY